MNRIRQATEDEMVLEFLRAEIDSNVRRSQVAQSLQRLGRSRDDLVDRPVDNQRDNSDRKKLLSYRGYTQRVALFAGFPLNVSWDLVKLEAQELKAARYAKVVDWYLLSGGSRRVGDAARAVLKGRVSELGGLNGFSESKPGDLRAMADRIRAISDAYIAGQRYPKLILVEFRGDIVLVEGYHRVTAYVHSGIEEPVYALVGSSAKMAGWYPLTHMMA